MRKPTKDSLTPCVGSILNLSTGYMRQLNTSALLPILDFIYTHCNTITKCRKNNIYTYNDSDIISKQWGVLKVLQI